MYTDARTTHTVPSVAVFFPKASHLPPFNCVEQILLYKEALLFKAINLAKLDLADAVELYTYDG